MYNLLLQNCIRNPANADCSWAETKAGLDERWGPTTQAAARRSRDSAQAPPTWAGMNPSAMAPANPRQAIHEPLPHWLCIQPCLPAPVSPLLRVKCWQKVLTNLCLKVSCWLLYRLGNTPVPCWQQENVDKNADWKRKAQQMGFHQGWCSEHAYSPIERSSWKLHVSLEAIHSGIRLNAPWLARPVIQSTWQIMRNNCYE